MSARLRRDRADTPSGSRTRRSAMAAWRARDLRSSLVNGRRKSTLIPRPTASASRRRVPSVGLFRPLSYAAMAGCEVPAARASPAWVTPARSLSLRTSFMVNYILLDILTQGSHPLPQLPLVLPGADEGEDVA